MTELIAVAKMNLTQWNMDVQTVLRSFDAITSKNKELGKQTISYTGDITAFKTASEQVKKIISEITGKPAVVTLTVDDTKAKQTASKASKDLKDSFKVLDRGVKFAYDVTLRPKFEESALQGQVDKLKALTKQLTEKQISDGTATAKGTTLGDAMLSSINAAIKKTEQLEIRIQKVNDTKISEGVQKFTDLTLKAIADAQVLHERLKNINAGSQTSGNKNTIANELFAAGKALDDLYAKAPVGAEKLRAEISRVFASIAQTLNKANPKLKIDLDAREAQAKTDKIKALLVSLTSEGINKINIGVIGKSDKEIDAILFRINRLKTIAENLVVRLDPQDRATIPLTNALNTLQRKAEAFQKSLNPTTVVNQQTGQNVSASFLLPKTDGTQADLKAINKEIGTIITKFGEAKQQIMSYGPVKASLDAIYEGLKRVNITGLSAAAENNYINTMKKVKDAIIEVETARRNLSFSGDANITAHTGRVNTLNTALNNTATTYALLFAKGNKLTLPDLKAAEQQLQSTLVRSTALLQSLDPTSKAAADVSKRILELISNLENLKKASANATVGIDASQALRGMTQVKVLLNELKAERSLFAANFGAKSAESLQALIPRLEAIRQKALDAQQTVARTSIEFAQLGNVARQAAASITQAETSLNRIATTNQLTSFLQQANVQLNLFKQGANDFLSFAKYIDQANISAKIFEGQLGRVNISLAEGSKISEQLATDLLLPLQTAQNSLQIMIRNGFTLAQAMDISKRAVASGLAFGKTAEASLEGLTSAIQSNSSARLNFIGIAGNFGDFEKRFARELGTTTANLTKQQRALSQYKTVVSETDEELSNLGILQGGVSGSISKLKNEFTKAALQLQEEFAPAVKNVAEVLGVILKLGSGTPLGNAFISSLGVIGLLGTALFVVVKTFGFATGAARLFALGFTANIASTVAALQFLQARTLAANLGAALVPAAIAFRAFFLSVATGAIATGQAFGILGLNIVNFFTGTQLRGALWASSTSNSFRLVASSATAMGVQLSAAIGILGLAFIAANAVGELYKNLTLLDIDKYKLEEEVSRNLFKKASELKKLGGTGAIESSIVLTTFAKDSATTDEERKRIQDVLDKKVQSMENIAIEYLRKKSPTVLINASSIKIALQEIRKIEIANAEQSKDATEDQINNYEQLAASLEQLKAAFDGSKPTEFTKAIVESSKKLADLQKQLDSRDLNKTDRAKLQIKFDDIKINVIPSITQQELERVKAEIFKTENDLENKRVSLMKEGIAKRTVVLVQETKTINEEFAKRIEVAKKNLEQAKSLNLPPDQIANFYTVLGTLERQSQQGVTLLRKKFNEDNKKDIQEVNDKILEITVKDNERTLTIQQKASELLKDETAKRIKDGELTAQGISKTYDKQITDYKKLITETTNSVLISAYNKEIVKLSADKNAELVLNDAITKKALEEIELNHQKAIIGIRKNTVSDSLKVASAGVEAANTNRDEALERANTLQQKLKIEKDYQEKLKPLLAQEANFRRQVADFEAKVELSTALETAKTLGKFSGEAKLAAQKSYNTTLLLNQQEYLNKLAADSLAGDKRVNDATKDVLKERLDTYLKFLQDKTGAQLASIRAQLQAELLSAKATGSVEQVLAVKNALKELDNQVQANTRSAKTELNKVANSYGELDAKINDAFGKTNPLAESIRKASLPINQVIKDVSKTIEVLKEKLDKVEPGSSLARDIESNILKFQTRLTILQKGLLGAKSKATADFYSEQLIKITKFNTEQADSEFKAGKITQDSYFISLRVLRTVFTDKRKQYAKDSEEYAKYGKEIAGIDEKIIAVKKTAADKLKAQAAKIKADEAREEAERLRAIKKLNKENLDPITSLSSASKKLETTREEAGTQDAITKSYIAQVAKLKEQSLLYQNRINNSKRLGLSEEEIKTSTEGIANNQKIIADLQEKSKINIEADSYAKILRSQIATTEVQAQKNILIAESVTLRNKEISNLQVELNGLVNSNTNLKKQIELREKINELQSANKEEAKTATVPIPGSGLAITKTAASQADDFERVNQLLVAKNVIQLENFRTIKELRDAEQEQLSLASSAVDAAKEQLATAIRQQEGKKVISDLELKVFNTGSAYNKLLKDRINQLDPIEQATRKNLQYNIDTATSIDKQITNSKNLQSFLDEQVVKTTLNYDTLVQTKATYEQIQTALATKQNAEKESIANNERILDLQNKQMQSYLDINKALTSLQATLSLTDVSIVNSKQDSITDTLDELSNNARLIQQAKDKGQQVEDYNALIVKQADLQKSLYEQIKGINDFEISANNEKLSIYIAQQEALRNLLGPTDDLIGNAKLDLQLTKDKLAQIERARNSSFATDSDKRKLDQEEVGVLNEQINQALALRKKLYEDIDKNSSKELANLGLIIEKTLQNTIYAKDAYLQAYAAQAQSKGQLVVIEQTILRAKDLGLTQEQINALKDEQKKLTSSIAADEVKMAEALEKQLATAVEIANVNLASQTETAKKIAESLPKNDRGVATAQIDISVAKQALDLFKQQRALEDESKLSKLEIAQLNFKELQLTNAIGNAEAKLTEESTARSLRKKDEIIKQFDAQEAIAVKSAQLLSSNAEKEFALQVISNNTAANKIAVLNNVITNSKKLNLTEEEQIAIAEEILALKRTMISTDKLVIAVYDEQKSRLESSLAVDKLRLEAKASFLDDNEKANLLAAGGIQLAETNLEMTNKYIAKRKQGVLTQDEELALSKMQLIAEKEVIDAKEVSAKQQVANLNYSKEGLNSLVSLDKSRLELALATASEEERSTALSFFAIEQAKFELESVSKYVAKRREGKLTKQEEVQLTKMQVDAELVLANAKEEVNRKQALVLDKQKVTLDEVLGSDKLLLQQKLIGLDVDAKANLLAVSNIEFAQINLEIVKKYIAEKRKGKLTAEEDKNLTKLQLSAEIELAQAKEASHLQSIANLNKQKNLYEQSLSLIESQVKLEMNRNGLNKDSITQAAVEIAISKAKIAKLQEFIAEQRKANVPQQEINASLKEENDLRSGIIDKQRLIKEAEIERAGLQKSLEGSIRAFNNSGESDPVRQAQNTANDATTDLASARELAADSLLKINSNMTLTEEEAKNAKVQIDNLTSAFNRQRESQKSLASAYAKQLQDIRAVRDALANLNILLADVGDANDAMNSRSKQLAVLAETKTGEAVADLRSALTTGDNSIIAGAIQNYTSALSNYSNSLKGAVTDSLVGAKSVNAFINNLERNLPNNSASTEIIGKVKAFSDNFIRSGGVFSELGAAISAKFGSLLPQSVINSAKELSKEADAVVKKGAVKQEDLIKKKEIAEEKARQNIEKQITGQVKLTTAIESLNKAIGAKNAFKDFEDSFKVKFSELIEQATGAATTSTAKALKDAFGKADIKAIVSVAVSEGTKEGLENAFQEYVVPEIFTDSIKAQIKEAFKDVVFSPKVNFIEPISRIELERAEDNMMAAFEAFNARKKITDLFPKISIKSLFTDLDSPIYLKLAIDNQVQASIKKIIDSLTKGITDFKSVFSDAFFTNIKAKLEQSPKFDYVSVAESLYAQLKATIEAAPAIKIKVSPIVVNNGVKAPTVTNKPGITATTNITNNVELNSTVKQEFSVVEVIQEIKDRLETIQLQEVRYSGEC